jgi:Zn-dependent protease with chaperone function
MSSCCVGGKIFVFTGILPICKDEDGLAAVLGHG